MEWQIDYLKKSYANAVRVSTENRSIKEIVDEIKTYILEND